MRGDIKLYILPEIDELRHVRDGSAAHALSVEADPDSIETLDILHEVIRLVATF